MVTNYTSIGSLINHLPSLYRMLTHVFVDDVDELVASRNFRYLVRESAARQLGIKFLYFKTIYDMISGRDHYLADWNIADRFKNQTPPVEQAPKRPQDSAGPSGVEGAVKRLRLAAHYFRTEKEANAPYKAGRKDGDIREAAFGKKINRDRVKEPDNRQVVVFKRYQDQWVNNVD